MEAKCYATNCPSVLGSAKEARTTLDLPLSRCHSCRHQKRRALTRRRRRAEVAAACLNLGQTLVNTRLDASKRCIEAKDPWLEWFRVVWLVPMENLRVFRTTSPSKRSMVCRSKVAEVVDSASLRDRACHGRHIGRGMDCRSIRRYLRCQLGDSLC